jgi:hypothetical protein
MRETGEEGQRTIDMISRDVRDAKGSTKTIKIGAGTDEFSKGIITLDCNYTNLTSVTCTSKNNLVPGSANANTLILFSNDNYKIYVSYNNGIYYKSVAGLPDSISYLDMASVIADKYKITQSSHESTFLISGFAPAKLSTVSQQPYIVVQVSSKTANYDNLSSAARAQATIRTLISSRNYN